MSAPPHILVVGSGVLGLCTAFELTRRGHAVTIIDPGGPNASSIAAGMIAPALESATEDVTPRRAALLRDAAGLWPAFAAAAGVDLRPGPAIWKGADAEEIERRLHALGFDAERRADVVQTPHDTQVEPEAAMAALRALSGRPVVGRVRSVERPGEGWRVTTDDGVFDAGMLVLATGTAPAIPGLPDKVAALLAGIEPIRGQIGRTGQPLSDHVVRGPDGYVAPTRGGTLIGATMEAGRWDVKPDLATGRALAEAGARLLGRGPITGPVDWRVGIRGASPDGLPMAGPSGAPDLHLALAPRRNGWLLGPLVAQTVADAIERRAPGPHAAALDPSRRWGFLLRHRPSVPGR